MELSDYDIEAGFILTLLKFPEKIEIAKSTIFPGDLDDGFYQNAYSAMLRLHSEGKRIAQGNLNVELGSETATLFENAKARPDLICIDSFEDFMDEIHNKASVFKAKNKLRETISRIDSGEMPLPEIIAAVQNSASDITQLAATNSKDVGCIEDIIDAFKDDLAERVKSDGSITGLRTGLVELDDKLNGIQGGQYIVVAGRPGMGKTAVAMNMMENICKEGGSVLIFSMEMRRQQLMYRIIANQANIDLDHLRRGNLSEREIASMAQAIREMRDGWDLRIVDKGGITWSMLKSYILTEHHKNPLSAVMIDYLQLMSLSGIVGDSKNDKIGEISKGLKALALDLDIPIVVLSQLSREVEKRANKRPVNSDLRDSGAIEQDADVIMFTYRDEVYHADTPDKGIAEIIIGKIREGVAGTVKHYFEGQYSRFKSMISLQELDEKKAKELAEIQEKQAEKENKPDAFDAFDVTDSLTGVEMTEESEENPKDDPLEETFGIKENDAFDDFPE